MDMELRLRFALTARIAKADLLAADAAFVADATLQSWLAALKLGFIALANVVDLASATKSLYRDAPEVSEQFKRIESAVQFARYLRNIFIGHHNDQLLDKALEWKPEIRTLVAAEESVSGVIELFILETAINTYVNDDGCHRIFDSETDLVYPPNIQRFNHFLEQTIRGAISYLDALIVVLLNGYIAPSFADSMPLFVKAGSTDFGFVTKGKR